MFINRIRSQINVRRKKAIATQEFAELPENVREMFFDNFGYTAPLSLVAKVRELILDKNVRKIFEVGGGVTSYAATLAHPEVNLTTVDESTHWQDHLAQKMNENQRNQTIFMTVPMSDSGLALERLSSLETNSHYDLVIIDGPSKCDRFTSNTMKFYQKLISSTPWVIIDDTDREENLLAAEELANSCHRKIVHLRDPIYTGHRFSLMEPGENEATQVSM